MIVIDSPVFKKGRKLYCHLMSDLNDKSELHAFANKIGIKECWYEISASGIPHYDLNKEQHKIAIEAGARYIENRKELVALIKRLSR